MRLLSEAATLAFELVHVPTSEVPVRLADTSAAAAMTTSQAAVVVPAAHKVTEHGAALEIALQQRVRGPVD